MPGVGPVVEVPERRTTSNPMRKDVDHCELCDDSMVTNGGVHGMGHCVQPEAVEHPSHYGGDVTHEVWKCLEAWGLEEDAILWNAAKYIGRAHRKKDKLEDLKKARYYLQRRIDSLEEKTT